jgi:hypothetical protein
LPVIASRAVSAGTAELGASEDLGDDGGGCWQSIADQAAGSSGSSILAPAEGWKKR